MRPVFALICHLTIGLALAMPGPAAMARAEGDAVELPQSPELPSLWTGRLPGMGDRAIAFRAANIPTAIAAFGPFRVIDATHAALVGVTDGSAPRDFRAMLARYPGIATLELIECPGTEDDQANLELGRMIRAAGLTTRVPDGGSVRSGAVELFLAGARREMEPGARFAVHSWQDDEGKEAHDFAPDAPENAAYLSYYREMGMTADAARAFYDMTNSVPNADARWLNAQDMRFWLNRGSGHPVAFPDSPAMSVSPAAPVPASAESMIVPAAMLAVPTRAAAWAGGGDGADARLAALSAAPASPVPPRIAYLDVSGAGL